MWNCNTLVDDYIAEARIEENGNESGISKELQLFGRKKEAAMEKPGKMKIHICSSNDLQYLWFERGHFGNSNVPLDATILEKCSRSKERFPFTSSISALFGMRDLLIYFFCWIWKRGLWMIGYLRMLFKPFWWNNTKICDIVIYVYILTNFIYKFRWLTRAIINVIFEVISHVMNSFFLINYWGMYINIFYFYLIQNPQTVMKTNLWLSVHS